jgi:hypothetical protein
MLKWKVNARARRRCRRSKVSRKAVDDAQVRRWGSVRSATCRRQRRSQVGRRDARGEVDGSLRQAFGGKSGDKSPQSKAWRTLATASTSVECLIENGLTRIAELPESHVETNMHLIELQLNTMMINLRNPRLAWNIRWVRGHGVGARGRGQSGRGLPHSKPWRNFRCASAGTEPPSLEMA